MNPKNKQTPKPNIKEKTQTNKTTKKVLRGSPPYAGGRCLTPPERETAAPGLSLAPLAARPSRSFPLPWWRSRGSSAARGSCPPRGAPHRPLLADAEFQGGEAAGLQRRSERRRLREELDQTTGEWVHEVDGGNGRTAGALSSGLQLPACKVAEPLACQEEAVGGAASGARCLSGDVVFSQPRSGVRLPGRNVLRVPGLPLQEPSSLPPIPFIAGGSELRKEGRGPFPPSYIHPQVFTSMGYVISHHFSLIISHHFCVSLKLSIFLALFWRLCFGSYCVERYYFFLCSFQNR